MFGIGAGELFVIFIIAIVVIGPKQLPDVARTIGKVFTTFKRTSNQLREQMHEEVRKFQEMDEIKDFKSSLESEIASVKDTAEEYVQAEFNQEEQRFKDEAKSLERELMAEGGPLNPDPVEPYGSASTPAPEGSVQREGESAPDIGTAAAPAPEEVPESAPAPGANGSTPAHTGPGDTAATSPPGKPLV